MSMAIRIGKVHAEEIHYKLLFSERLKAAVELIGQFVLTGWQIKINCFQNLLVIKSAPLSSTIVLIEVFRIQII